MASNNVLCKLRKKMTENFESHFCFLLVFQRFFACFYLFIIIIILSNGATLLIFDRFKGKRGG